MRGRGRMRVRQPGMQRHKTRLDAEADKEQQEHRHVGTLKEILPERLKIIRARPGMQKDECHDEEQGADMHLYQIVDAGPQGAAFFIVEDHQHERRYRHQLPHHQERDALVHHANQYHRKMQQEE